MYEEVTTHDQSRTQSNNFSLKGGGRPMTMPAITIIFMGFVAGLFAMTIINLYRYMLRYMNDG